MQAERIFQASEMTAYPRPDLVPYDQLLLAEGDSWFTIGSLNVFRNSNLLLASEFSKPTGIVTCARPGDTLQHMVDSVHDPYFDRLLWRKKFALDWAGILLSAGGNDLIDALQVTPLDAHGQARRLSERLLLTPAEAQTVQPDRAGIDRYVSEPGWHTLAGYLLENLGILVARKAEGRNRGRPILMHTYSLPIPRTTPGTVTETRWLYPGMAAYGIPVPEMQALSDHLFERLRALLLSVDRDAGGPGALPTVHVFDSARRVSLDRADPADPGNSGDWINEIHPNPSGYNKLGDAFGPWIEQILASYR